jgi:hypothetical protein
MTTTKRTDAERLAHLAPHGKPFKIVAAAAKGDPRPKPEYTAEQRERFKALALKALALGMAKASEGL